MKRELWGSRVGFILAAVGSAIGLANIVRFPYLVGQNGGSAFILIYLGCLIFIGFPVFVAEIVIGRRTHKNPYGAFVELGQKSLWHVSGKMVVLTGFIVSSFYSALAGWILGYLIEAIQGNLNHFNSIADATNAYTTNLSLPYWGLMYHGLFIFLCTFVLYTGVRKGLERFSKFLMPMMFLVLVYLVVSSLQLPNSFKSLTFLLQPRWEHVTPTMFLLALGQSCFTLSAGQGTMITYGSYLPKKINIITSCLPIVIADTLVSILAAVVVFSVVFSTQVEPDGGIGLIFHTLPLVFSKLSGGYVIGVAFFLLVILAALTSEISAMEPVIAYLIDEKKMSRQKAVRLCGLGAFVLGIPSALSYSVLKNFHVYGKNIFEIFDFIATGILIPLGGLLAVLLVGWQWGLKACFTELKQGAEGVVDAKWMKTYLGLGIKYIAPVAIAIIAFKGLM